MPTSNRCSRLAMILLMGACAAGGSLVTSLRSQSDPQIPAPAEVGRFQYCNGAIFDTKTAHLWSFDGVSRRWQENGAPWEANQRLGAPVRQLVIPAGARLRPLPRAQNDEEVGGPPR